MGAGHPYTCVAEFLRTYGGVSLVVRLQIVDLARRVQFSYAAQITPLL